MSNYTHAVAIIMKATKHPELAHDVVEELDNEGLIAPDLPKPNAPGNWELANGVTVTADDGEVIITEKLTGAQTMICWRGSLHSARVLANALYAAANYTETDK